MRGNSFRASFLAVLFVILVATQTSCGPQQVPVETLRFGILPIDKALPLYVAEQEGFFSAQGVKVELVLFSSAVERDAAMQAKQLDGQLGDLFSTALLNQGGTKVIAVRTIMNTTPETPMYTILAAPTSKIRTVNDLRGVEIGVSMNTVIEYITDKLLVECGGLSAEEFRKVEVSKIPVRLEMLATGKLEAATFPEPTASLAAGRGTRVIVDDRACPAPPSTLVFNSDALRSKRDAIKKFLVANEQAVQVIDSKPKLFSSLLVEKGLIPKDLEGAYIVPPFPGASVPSREEVNEVIGWLISKRLLTEPIPYEAMINATFLPSSP